MYLFFKKKLEIASEFSPVVSLRIQKWFMLFLTSCLQKCLENVSYYGILSKRSCQYYVIFSVNSCRIYHYLSTAA